MTNIAFSKLSIGAASPISGSSKTRELSPPNQGTASSETKKAAVAEI